MKLMRLIKFPKHILGNLPTTLAMILLLLGAGINSLQAQSGDLLASFYNSVNGITTNQGTAEPGDLFTMTVGISSPEEMAAATISLHWDPNIIQVVDDGIVDAAGEAYNFFAGSALFNEQGYLTFSKVSTNSPSPTGSIDFVTITFLVNPDLESNTTVMIEHVVEAVIDVVPGENIFPSQIAWGTGSVLSPAADAKPSFSLMIEVPVLWDCPSIPANIGDSCDDGDASTENDEINANCECVGTSIYDCPDLSANIGDACDDENAATENDMITDNCECAGTPIVYDCPNLSANIGDACDDEDESTENDIVNANCECVGTSIYDCPNLSANIGDPCDDNVESTVDDVITEDCECVGTPVILENTAALCSDGIDNDGDGLTDCEDPNCQAIANNIGCLTCFEDGLSFADEVIEYVSNCSNNISTNPEAALGMPDYSGSSTQHATLGRGFIKLGFTNNTLVYSGTPEADLFIFEVGPLVESSFIELRPSNAETEALCIAAGILDSDGDGFYEFGGIGGALAAVDIDAFFDDLPPASVFFDAIKIIDAPGSCSTSTPGADIDAVCALSSISCVVGEACDDGNPDTENDVLNADCE